MKLDLLKLIPKGKIWDGKTTKYFFRTLEIGLQRLHDEASTILLECFPETSEKLLEDWLRLCNAKTWQGVNSTLAATGGNSYEFFENIVKIFDSNCRVYRDDGIKFIVGNSRAGEYLGFPQIPDFTVVFLFSVYDTERKIEAEELLNKLKPAHVHFSYCYKHNINGPFFAGYGLCGDRI